jgi:hypothetical protein
LKEFAASRNLSHFEVSVRANDSASEYSVNRVFESMASDLVKLYELKKKQAAEAIKLAENV